jgi:hypothetical protein
MGRGLSVKNHVMVSGIRPRYIHTYLRKGYVLEKVQGIGVLQDGMGGKGDGHTKAIKLSDPNRAMRIVQYHDATGSLTYYVPASRPE